eukprot:s422_g30.t1
MRKRAAMSTAARLEPLRKRLRRARVLRETWEAIAQRRNMHGQSRVEHPQASRATNADKSACVAQAPPVSHQKSPEYVYTCPFCNGAVAFVRPCDMRTHAQLAELMSKAAKKEGEFKASINNRMVGRARRQSGERAEQAQNVAPGQGNAVAVKDRTATKCKPKTLQHVV